MIVALKTIIIGVHFFCFRAINEVPGLIQESFKFVTAGREISKRQLAAQSARCDDRRVAKLIPEAKARLDLLSKVREGREIAPHEAHNFPQPPDTLLGLTH